MEYSRAFGSKFPSSLIDIETKKDVDDSCIDLVNQYNAYMLSGNVNVANTLYEQNKDVLASRKISMDDYNLPQEELHNIGLYVLNKTAITISEDEPTEMQEGSIWYELLEVVE